MSFSDISSQLAVPSYAPSAHTLDILTPIETVPLISGGSTFESPGDSEVTAKAATYFEAVSSMTWILMNERSTSFHLNSM